MRRWLTAFRVSGTTNGDRRRLGSGAGVPGVRGCMGVAVNAAIEVSIGGYYLLMATSAK